MIGSVLFSLLLCVCVCIQACFSYYWRRLPRLNNRKWDFELLKKVNHQVSDSDNFSASKIKVCSKYEVTWEKLNRQREKELKKRIEDRKLFQPITANNETHLGGHLRNRLEEQVFSEVENAAYSALKRIVRKEVGIR